MGLKKEKLRGARLRGASPREAMPLFHQQEGDVPLHGLTIGNSAKSSGDSASNPVASTIRGVKPLKAFP